MAPLTAEELLKHPEYNFTIWDLKPESKGKVAVAKDRGGPINIAYEVHGHGDRHLVVSSSIFHYKYHLQRSALQIRHTLRNICQAGEGRGFGSTPTIPGSELLSPFRFGRIDRLNLAAPRLMFLNPHGCAIICITLSFVRLFPSWAKPTMKTSPRHTSAVQCTLQNSESLTQCSGLWALVA